MSAAQQKRATIRRGLYAQPDAFTSALRHAWQRNDERAIDAQGTITDHRLERELAEAFAAGDSASW